MQEHSPIDLEHRLTVVEVTQDHHDNRLDSLEKSVISPRDWLMIAAGILTILGALSGKIDWEKAVALLSRN